MTATDERPLRVCDVCGAVDRDPRHSDAGTILGDRYDAPSEDVVNRVIDSAPAEDRGRLLRDLMDRTSFDRHLDCCAEAGCPLPADDPNSCPAKLAGAKGKTGDALVKHIDKYVRDLTTSGQEA